MMRRLLFALCTVACKGGDSDVASKKVETQKPVAEVKPVEQLPDGFPLPDSPKRKLVRSVSRITASVWEYEYPDLTADAIAKTIDGSMRALVFTMRESDAQHILASQGGHTYDVGIAAVGAGSRLTIRAFPDAGPLTLNAPPSYPTSFPFLAGGTAGHAPDGAQLRVAYQLDAKDVEAAMLLAATTAGWTCTGAGTLTCSKDAATVTFTTESAPGGSLLVVSAR